MSESVDHEHFEVQVYEPGMDGEPVVVFVDTYKVTWTLRTSSGEDYDPEKFRKAMSRRDGDPMIKIPDGRSVDWLRRSLRQVGFKFDKMGGEEDGNRVEIGDGRK